MKKRKRLFLWIAIPIALIALASLFLLSQGCAGGYRVTTVFADIYVDGVKLEKPAIIYWYITKDPPPYVWVKVPFFDTLEALGCEIDRDESRPSSDAIIEVNGRRFIYKAVSSTLYENDKPLYKGAAVPLFSNGKDSESQILEGQLYMEHDLDSILTVLKAFGFNQLEATMDRDPFIVRINMGE